jgi:NAD(P)H dehydrogenase (quinone)
MNVLIVYAHEEPHSFNAAMKNVAVETLEDQEHTVEVSDLYRMRFKAVADGSDFLERRDRNYLKRQLEEQIAGKLGTLAGDIVAEQQKVMAARLVILQFPLWWFSMPAILKGWVDRVLTMGFAYGSGKWYDQGCLRGRRAMLALTTGGPEAGYLERGINGPMDRILYPIHHGILYFCGFQVLPPFVAWNPAKASPQDRQLTLDRYRRRLQDLDSLRPLPFHPLDHYGEGMQLKPDFT